MRPGPADIIDIARWKETITEGDALFPRAILAN
jgi:hypothetical protein